MAHTGQLQTDSPALYGELKRRFSADEITRIAAAYAECVAGGGLDEGAVIRDPEVSYNPRPARVCQILLKEYKETSVDLIVEALGPTSSKSQSVILAILIDELRHLHMSNLKRDEIQGRMKDSKKILSDCRDESLERLKIVAQSALEHLERMYG